MPTCFMEHYLSLTQDMVQSVSQENGKILFTPRLMTKGRTMSKAPSRRIAIRLILLSTLLPGCPCQLFPRLKWYAYDNR